MENTENIDRAESIEKARIAAIQYINEVTLDSLGDEIKDKETLHRVFYEYLYNNSSKIDLTYLSYFQTEIERTLRMRLTFLENRLQLKLLGISAN